MSEAQAFRTEHDTLGEIAVPAAALYGAQTERAVRNFPISGQRLPKILIRSLGAIKQACAHVNGATGRLEASLAEVIERAATEVSDGMHDEQFVVDVFQTGSGTSSNMNANEVIANRAAELLGKPRGSGIVHANDHVNLGQSSNDVFPSAIHLALMDIGERLLLPQVTALATTLHDLADRTFGLVKTGRTHLMDAMPIRFGQQFRGQAQQVERFAERIRQAWSGLREVPLGGTAVGTGVNAPDGFGAAVCARLATTHGWPVRSSEAPFQAQASLDAVAHSSATLRGFAMALYKIANDVRWSASSAIGELQLPVLQPGSSIMPAKVNPVACEAVLMVCVQVCGNDAAVAFGNSQGQFELNTMMPLIGKNALESAALLGNACLVLREKCLEGIVVTAIASERVAHNPMLVTALTDLLGYEKAAAIGKEAAATRRTVKEVAQQRSGLDAITLDRLLDPAHLCGERGRRR